MLLIDGNMNFIVDRPMKFPDQWEKRIRDPSAPQTAKELVQGAKATLDKDQDYLFLKSQLKGQNFDALINEFLRFLAMKAIIDSEQNAPSTSVNYATGEPVPSQCILDVWSTIMLSPTLYGKVCKAIGLSDDVISCNVFGSKDDEEDFLREDWYQLTLRSYAILWKESPPKEFWPDHFNWMAATKIDMFRSFQWCVDWVELQRLSLSNGTKSMMKGAMVEVISLNTTNVCMASL